MKTKLTILAALILMLTAQTANAFFFFFIPPGVIGKKGNYCVGPNVQVGYEFKSPNGETLTVKKVSGKSGRCKQPEFPTLVEAEITASQTFASKVRLDLPDGYEQKPLTDEQKANGGVLFATRSKSDTYILVTSVSRDRVPDLDISATNLRVAQANRLTSPNQTNIERMQIGGLEARRFELEGKYHATRYTFVGTLLQGDNEVVYVVGWAPTAHYNQYKAELLHVSESVVGLHQTPSVTSLQPFDVSPPSNDAVPQNGTTSPVSEPPSADTVAPQGVGRQQASDIEERLRKLSELYKDGLINQQDYEAKKAEILKTL